MKLITKLGELEGSPQEFGALLASAEGLVMVGKTIKVNPTETTPAWQETFPPLSCDAVTNSIFIRSTVDKSWGLQYPQLRDKLKRFAQMLINTYPDKKFITDMDWHFHRMEDGRIAIAKNQRDTDDGLAYRRYLHNEIRTVRTRGRDLARLYESNDLAAYVPVSLEKFI